MAKKKAGQGEPVVIKKYANRRLYDTGRSSYVTLEDLCDMVKDGYDFVVYDAKSGEDITRSVLTQIIVDQETKGGEDGGLLPTSFLKNLIGFYGDNVQSLVPNYLENSFELFVKNQEKVREQFTKSFETVPGLNVNGSNGINGMNMFSGNPSSLEEINRKNLEMFERTMKMFTPFNTGYDGDSQTEDN